jgi:hypothetical protein
MISDITPFSAIDRIVASSDDQVIKYAHIHQRQCRFQCMRERLVGALRPKGQEVSGINAEWP